MQKETGWTLLSKASTQVAVGVLTHLLPTKMRKIKKNITLSPLTLRLVIVLRIRIKNIRKALFFSMYCIAATMISFQGSTSSIK